MDYDITGYKSPTLHLGGKPDSEVYSRTYDLPVPTTHSFDLTAENFPEGIKLYNHNWSILAGKITSPDIWKDYQDYYLNCIQDNDNNLMQVIDCLRQNGMLSNTIIIFTADHGEMHGSHALKGKGGFMYENNIHEVLEEFTRQNIAMHGRNAVIGFAWHGGEPVLAGVDFSGITAFFLVSALTGRRSFTTNTGVIHLLMP